MFAESDSIVCHTNAIRVITLFGPFKRGRTLKRMQHHMTNDRMPHQLDFGASHRCKRTCVQRNREKDRTREQIPSNTEIYSLFVRRLHCSGLINWNTHAEKMIFSVTICRKRFFFALFSTQCFLFMSFCILFFFFLCRWKAVCLRILSLFVTSFISIAQTRFVCSW